MASNLMSEERKPPDTDSEEDGKCSISITFLKFSDSQSPFINMSRLVVCKPAVLFENRCQI